MTPCTAIAAVIYLAAGGPWSVYDGDTISRADNCNLRIFGIDAPEMGTREGRAARDAMRAIIGTGGLTCQDMGPASWERREARCFRPDGQDIACLLVAGGWAVDWPEYSGGAYRECE